MTEHYASKMRAMNCAVLPKLNPIEKCDYAAEFWWKYARKVHGSIMPLELFLIIDRTVVCLNELPAEMLFCRFNC